MKIPRSFTICNLRFAIGRKSSRLNASEAVESSRQPNGKGQSSAVNPQSEKGIALVITLIMLAVTLVMAVAFMALARRERSTVSGIHDTKVAQLAAEAALARAQSQIAASIEFNPGNAYNFGLFVSTNYINPYGFVANAGNPIGNPTNVNYNYTSLGAPVNGVNLEQNISNLWYLPRAPVYIPLGQPATNYDFRYYLDLNENGRYDTNYFGQDVDNLGNPLPGQPYQHVGDPEWIGVLEHPDAPHGPNNQFTSRFAFIAIPAGNTMDFNYIYNQSKNGTFPQLATLNDYFMRNQGVGSWEINLAAFLADLNTNEWNHPLNAYQYNEPSGPNSGYAFDDARELLAYRYNSNALAPANSVLSNAQAIVPHNGIDVYSDGHLQTTLDTNEDFLFPLVNTALSWSGADNTNHYFTPSDFLDPNKTAMGLSANYIALHGDFVNRLKAAGSSNDTYDAYTYYRMLDELGSDSGPDDGKLNLNYANATVTYSANPNIRFHTAVVTSVSVVPGAETNLVPWRPQDFFNAAADRMLHYYTTNWFQSNPTNFLITYYGIAPQWPVSATGQGSPNYPSLGLYTNQIPSFGITNIPVMVNGHFVYTPAVNRLLQLAANIYDASTNGPPSPQGKINLPHVFRPVFENDGFGNVFIVGYTNVGFVSGTTDRQLAPPNLINNFTNFGARYTPFNDGSGSVNIYGVPWIIGAKKGLPNFNQLYMLNQAQVTRNVEITRTSLLPSRSYGTNEMISMGISNVLGASFWNSYSNYYGYPGPARPVTVFLQDFLSMALSNATFNLGWYSNYNFAYSGVINGWPGSRWSGLVPTAVPQNASFVAVATNFLFQSQLSYDFATHGFDINPQWYATTMGLPQFNLVITNLLQAYLLDGNSVIDYVQLNSPTALGSINQGLADPNYVQPGNIYYQWSTNLIPSSAVTPYGLANQLYISGHPPTPGPTPVKLMPAGGAWSTAPNPTGITTPQAEAAFFNGFFAPNSEFQFNGRIYYNDQLAIQAPYTPSRTAYSSFLLQANDPLVHYLGSDLNGQTNTLAIWLNNAVLTNGAWYHSDDPSLQPLPQAPTNPISGRYQPWGAKGQMGSLSGVDSNPENLAYKDSLAWGPDYWDFPTNPYPTVGWIGRVHRGTPWQTVYLKSTNILSDPGGGANPIPNAGLNTWANWTGDIQPTLGQYFDAYNTAPMQDFLLFDIFTTRFNDNAARGTLPINAGVGLPDGGLAAWSALFSGMVALTNSAPRVFAGNPPTYTNQIINPAGVVNPGVSNYLQPPLWQIVNGPYGINATRTNKNLFPYQSFIHAGDVLATPALTVQSPFINNGSVLGFGLQQWENGINDEEYEWLPQQMMGLVRASEPRYVVYCFGQTLRPAPGGTVLSGPYFQMVTNYQVVAESAIRAVIRVDNANTPTPHAVVESYNVLPPN